MTTEAQKILLESGVEMKKAKGGWTVVDIDDFEKLFDLLNDNSTGQENYPPKSMPNWEKEDPYTIYTFSDGSTIKEEYDEDAEKVFNYYQ